MGLIMVIIIEDDKEKPIEEVKPKTRVEFEAYAKRLGAMIVANSVRNIGLSCNQNKCSECPFAEKHQLRCLFGYFGA